MQHVGRKYARHRATPTHAQVTSASKLNADKHKTPIKPLKYGDFRVPSGPLERKRKTSNTLEEVKKIDDRNVQKDQEEGGPLTRNRSARKLTKIPRTDEKQAVSGEEPVNSVESVKKKPGRPNVAQIKEKEPVKSIEPVKRGRRKPRAEKVKEIEPVAVVKPTKLDESLANNLVQKVRSNLLNVLCYNNK